MFEELISKLDIDLCLFERNVLSCVLACKKSYEDYQPLQETEFKAIIPCPITIHPDNESRHSFPVGPL